MRHDCELGNRYCGSVLAASAGAPFVLGEPAKAAPVFRLVLVRLDYHEVRRTILINQQKHGLLSCSGDSLLVLLDVGNRLMVDLLDHASAIEAHFGRCA